MFAEGAGVCGLGVEFMLLKHKPVVLSYAPHGAQPRHFP